MVAGNSASPAEAEAIEKMALALKEVSSKIKVIKKSVLPPNDQLNSQKEGTMGYLLH